MTTLTNEQTLLRDLLEWRENLFQEMIQHGYKIKLPKRMQLTPPVDESKTIWELNDRITALALGKELLLFQNVHFTTFLRKQNEDGTFKIGIRHNMSETNFAIYYEVLQHEFQILDRYKDQLLYNFNALNYYAEVTAND